MMYRYIAKFFTPRIEEKEFNKYYKVVVNTIIDWVIKGNIFVMPFDLGEIYILKKRFVPFWYKGNVTIWHPKLVDSNYVKQKAEEGMDYKDIFKKENIKLIKNAINFDRVFYKIYWNKYKSGNAESTQRMGYWYMYAKEEFRSQFRNFYNNTKQKPDYYDRKNINPQYYRKNTKKTSRWYWNNRRRSSREYMGSNETNRDTTK